MEKEKLLVIFEENGMDLFEGTRDECEAFIDEQIVKGEDRNNYGIY